MTIIAHPLDQLLIGSTPAPVLSAMMLPGWVWGFLVSTFVEGKSWRNRCNRVRLGAKNYELPSRVKRLHKFKTKVVRQFPFVKTHKNRVSSAKGVHLAEILLPCDKNRKVHKMCARYLEIPDIKFRRELGFGPIVNWFDPRPVLSAMMLPPPIYPISIVIVDDALGGGVLAMDAPRQKTSGGGGGGRGPTTGDGPPGGPANRKHRALLFM